jgi:hypothetical protein
MMLETADVFRRFGPWYVDKFGSSMPPSHKRAISDIAACRTKAMGGHVYQCDDCGQKLHVYHACRNRSCPACHKRQTENWLSKRELEILPSDYFHITATIPSELRIVFRSNQKDMYSLFFSVASDAILELTGDEKYLNAKVGMLAVLHTWTGELHYHPHIHFLITGGGIDNQGQWVAAKPKYLIPVKALSKLIKGKFAYYMRKKHPELYAQVDEQIWRKDWVCHSIHYGRGNKAVLNYLSRYVHRVAITNSRILGIDNEYVRFSYKDRKAKMFKTSELRGSEFMRRYLQHVLPKGFHKVRYYGIWHSSHKYHVLKLIKLMDVFDDSPQPAIKETVAVEQVQTITKPRCPHCKSEHLTLIEKLPRPRSRSPSISEIFKRLQPHNL